MLLAPEVLEDPSKVGQKVVIVGGGATGMETAEFLAEMGKTITVVEALEDVARSDRPGNTF